MGYLKRKLRRSAAGRIADAFLAMAAAEPQPGLGVVPAPPTGRFLRFATDDGRRGVFQAAYRLRDSRRLTADESAELRDLLGWFEKELKPHAPAEEAAVFWFKADAGDYVRRIWAIVRLLQRGGRDVRMWTTRRPGRIVFEDVFQVAAVPYRRSAAVAKQLPEER